MPNYTDTKVNDMIFNVLDSATYNTLLNNNQLNNNQLYFITNDGGTSITTTTESASINLAHSGKYKLTAGGYSTVFTLPAGYSHPTTTATSAAAVKVGKDSQGHVVLGSALTASDVGAATSGHTHTLSLATDTGTSSLTLAYGGKYKLTAGGNSLIFTMPSALTIDAYTKSEIDDKIANVFHYKGNKTAVSNLPTSGNETGDVWHITADNSEWAWDGSAWQELGTVGTNHTHTLSIATSTSTSNVVSLAHGGKYQLTAGGQTLIFSMPNNYSLPVATYSALGGLKPWYSTTGASSLPSGSSATQLTDNPAVNAHTTTSGRYYAIEIDKNGRAYVNVPWTNVNSSYAASDHTHTASLATSTSTTNVVSLAAGGKYQLTAGGSSVVFTLPSGYTHPTTTAVTAAAVKVGKDSSGHVVLGSALTASDVGASPSNHTHSLSIATDTGSSSITLSHGGKYKLTAGGSTYIFTMPASYSLPVATYNTLGGVKPAYSSTNAVTLTTAAASNTTTPTVEAKSTTTGRYYAVETDKNGVLFVNVPWENTNVSHTHSISLATDTGTSAITLAHGGKYKLTAGGSSVIFTLPSDSNTATAADNILDGSNSGTEIKYAPYTSQQSKLSFDTSTSNPSRTDRLNLNGYLYATKLYSGGTEVALSNHTHTLSLATDTGTSTVTLAHGGKYKLTAGGNSLVFTLPNDTQVTQAYSAANNNYPLLMTATAGITGTSSRGDTTIFSNNLYGNPTLGMIGLKKIKGAAEETVIASNIIRIRNASESNAAPVNPNNSNNLTYPYVTQIKIGDGDYILVSEYNDDDLSIKAGSILLTTRSQPATYDPTATYTVGTYVWYNQNYYKCKTAIETAEAWDASHWESTHGQSGIMADANLDPWIDNTYNLGSSSYRWKTIYAVNFEGTASVATKLGTSNKGNATKPIYLAAGVPTECSTYAGGTAVTLNGTSAAASTASFYAPTGAGTSGYILQSNGSGAPTWLQILPVSHGGTGLITTTNVNAVVIGNSSNAANAMQTIRTGNGAFYATAQDGKPQFGTLPVAQGGTGATTFTSGALLIGNGTSAVSTRAITNNTSNTAAGTGTNIPTMNTLYYALVTVNGNSQSRATGIYAPTSAGTNGYFLKSNGSGAPTWAEVVAAQIIRW